MTLVVVDTDVWQEVLQAQLETLGRKGDLLED